MKYYPRLKIFKGSSGNNTFDGLEARSYEWYVYAYVFKDKYYEVEQSYSPTTNRHISVFHSLVDGLDRVYIKAPVGLNHLDRAKESIESEIKDLNDQLNNKRNRNIERRKNRIERLEKMLLDLAELKTALAERKGA